MATTLEIEFPWGRYHATPWDRSANEGTPEWPPSPWRILRALYATWRQRQPNLSANVVEGLLGALAVPPTYLLPPAFEGHSRHYYPDIEDGTDLVFDPFMAFEPGRSLAVVWPVDLPGPEGEALHSLARSIGYLGRAESVCEARVVDEPRGDDRARSSPRTHHRMSGRFTRVLVPQAPLDIDCLTAGTAKVRGQRLVDPPGSAWVDYEMPISRSMAPVAVRRDVERPTMVRWTVQAPALPSIHAAVTMAEALRAAAMKQFDAAGEGRRSATLAGKDGDGNKAEGHGHAHYFATDEDGDGFIDHLTVWAPAGLDDAAMSALGRLRVLKGRGFEAVAGFRPVRLGLVAVGCADKTGAALARSSRVWTSHTPFAPTRHRKRRQDPEPFIADQVVLELQRRERPVPSVIARVEPGRASWPAFRRRRHRDAPDQNRMALGLRVEFDEPVAGPLSLGALNHFGLGLFLPES